MEHEHINPLEYRPKFDLTQKERVGWAGTPDAPSIEETSPLNDSAIQPGIIVDVLTEQKETLKRLEIVLEATEKLLAKQTLSLGDTTGIISEAKKDIGLSEGDITLLDYKEALLNIRTPAGAYLVGIIEEHIEDLDGTLDWEFYSEYMELIAELDLLQRYTEGLIYPVLGLTGDPDSDRIKEKEAEWLLKKEQVNQTFFTQEERFKAAMLFNPSTIAQEKGQLYELERSKTQLDHETSHLESTLVNVRKKTDSINRMIDIMSDIEIDRLDSTNVLKEATSLCENDDEVIENLTNLDLMLKLAVDSRNKEKHHLKNTLRNTYAPDKQETVLIELIAHHNVYTAVTLPTVHFLRAYQENVSKESEGLLNEIALGLKENATNETQKLYEYYALQNATTRLRESKLTNVSRKDKARQAYHLFQKEIDDRKGT